MTAFEVVTPVDNTILENLVHETFERGYSEHQRMTVPNQGICDNGDMIHYFQTSVLKVKDKIAVPKSDIFLVNGYLKKPGIVVEKYYVSRESDGLLLGDEQYFRVLDSNVEGVKQNDLVIVEARTGKRFNIDMTEFFFVHPEKILLVLSGDRGTVPGPFNMLLKYEEPGILGSDQEMTSHGVFDGWRYHFASPLYTVELNNEKHVVVSKKEVKVKEKIVG